jgi:hypothetical protein
VALPPQILPGVWYQGKVNDEESWLLLFKRPVEGGIFLAHSNLAKWETPQECREYAQRECESLLRKFGEKILELGFGIPMGPRPADIINQKTQLKGHEEG